MAIQKDGFHNRMAEYDSTMWWYRALHRNVLMAFDRTCHKPDIQVLDVGCGSGGLICSLQAHRPDARISAVELNPQAVEIATQRTGVPAKVGSVHELPFADNSFDCVIACDVLTQQGVEVDRSIAEIRRVMRCEGRFICSDAAFGWLASYHDEREYLCRRLTKRGLQRDLAKVGLNLVYATYWNTLLFPLVVARRKLFPPHDEHSDVRDYSSYMEALFNVVMRFETTMLKGGLRFPFGTSILTVSTPDHA